MRKFLIILILSALSLFSSLYAADTTGVTDTIDTAAVVDIVDSASSAAPADTLTISDTVNKDNTATSRNIAKTAKSAQHSEKFWIIEDIWQWFQHIGLSSFWANTISFFTLIGIMCFLVWLAAILIRKIFIAINNKILGDKPKSTFNSFLFRWRFFHRILYLLPLILVLFTIEYIFVGFHSIPVLVVTLIVRILIACVVLLIIYALLNALNDLYNTRPAARKRSIKGYIQIAKIILGFIVGIIIIVIFTQTNPKTILTGLGAAAALLLLVFKDPIIGFVASIQLSSQDMLRPGDWIEMPSQNADGTVIDINLTSVKVRNWDNTITMIPVFLMVSQSFINWRGIEKSGGRRFVRLINIDIKSIVPVDDTMLAAIKGNPLVAPLFDEMLELAKQSSPDFMNNIALYRAFFETYLRRSSLINPNLSVYVRYKNEGTLSGIVMEFYAFTRDKTAAGNDLVIRTVMEYAIVTAPVFSIEIFQKIS